MKLQMYMKRHDLSLNLRSSDLCTPVHVIHVHAHPQSSMLTSMYLYTWNHVDIQVHDTLAYTGTHLFSCLNYFCTELLSGCDIIFILVPKNILHTCFYAANISNEWTQWWINFLDCVTLHGCAECTCVYKLDCEIQDINIYFRKIWDHLV